MNYAEIFGALTGFLYVFLEIKQNKYMWIVGGISALVYTVIFLNSALFASMGLQVWYVGASLYGWVMWSNQSQESGIQEPMVMKLNKEKALYSSIIALLGFFILWFVLAKYSTDPMPVIDAFIASLSMLATYWVANRFIQHWILWIVTDLFAVYMYLSQGLYATVFLYIAYTIAAVAGLYHWRKFRKVLD